MQILATFDGSPASETALAQVVRLARQGDHVQLFSAVTSSIGGVRMRGPLRPVVGMAPLAAAEPVVVSGDTPKQLEARSQAIERELAVRTDYLQDLAALLPAGITSDCMTVAHDDPATAIIDHALSLQPDLIIMTTHGRTGLVHILFGDVAEEVVRSGVAPVLLVHPESVKKAREATRPSDPSLAGR